MLKKTRSNDSLCLALFFSKESTFKRNCSAKNIITYYSERIQKHFIVNYLQFLFVFEIKLDLWWEIRGGITEGCNNFKIRGKPASTVCSSELFAKNSLTPPHIMSFVSFFSEIKLLSKNICIKQRSLNLSPNPIAHHQHRTSQKDLIKRPTPVNHTIVHMGPTIKSLLHLSFCFSAGNWWWCLAVPVHFSANHRRAT